MTQDRETVTVAVVGGGLAGLTAALRLCQRGYQVTIYEANTDLGGNLSSKEFDGIECDVYPHMFPEWYANFWRIFEQDLGLSREEHFERHMSFKLLRRDQDGYLDLSSPTTLRAMWENLTSGLLPIPDMFLLGFSMLDLAAHPFESASVLNRQSVNGYLYSQGYATERVARVSDYILQLIWSIPSDRTAAQAYQDFVKHTLLFPRPTPFAWLLKGPSRRRIIEPWKAKLLSLGCEIRTGTPVRGINLDAEAPVLTLEEGEEVRPAGVILAVPGPALADLVMTGQAGKRLVDFVPHLSELSHLRGESLPVVNLYFNHKLPDIPPEVVGLLGSNLGLSFLDIAQLWTDDPNMQGCTALTLACSNQYALTSPDPLERGMMMIRALHEHLPVFRPGTVWGDPDSDICWAKTRYVANDDHKLYINEIGSLGWTSQTAYDNLPGVYFAGDFCRTDVNMATMEAAVQSGIQAAQALQSRAPRGEPIVAEPDFAYSHAVLLASKLMLLPAAYAATFWSIMSDQGAGRPEARSPRDTEADATLLPLNYAYDWLQTAYWLLQSLREGEGGKDRGRAAAAAARTQPVAGGGAESLAANAMWAAGDLLQSLAGRVAERRPNATLSDALRDVSQIAGEAWRAAQSAAAPDRRRRWRVKR